MNTVEGVARMRVLLDAYESSMAIGAPAAARDVAYEMVQVISGLYGAAYLASVRKAQENGGNAL